MYEFADPLPSGNLKELLRKDANEFIGFIGLLLADFKAHYTLATEIGWRLSSKHWGHNRVEQTA